MVRGAVAASNSETSHDNVPPDIRRWFLDRDAELFRYVTRLFELLLCSARDGAHGLARLVIVVGLTDDAGRLQRRNSAAFDEEVGLSPRRMQHAAPRSAVETAVDGGGAGDHSSALNGSDTSAKDANAGADALAGVLQLKYGRIDFESVMPKRSLVFVQGAGSVQRKVAAAA